MTFDVDFNYLERDSDGNPEWLYGNCEVNCGSEEHIEGTLLQKYEDVEVLEYVRVDR